METSKTHPHTYGGPGRLSGLYTLGRDGKPCPVYARDHSSAGYKAWRTGALDATAAMLDTSKAAAAMGRAGRGASKVRGDSDHYRALVAKRKDRGCYYCDRRPAKREALHEPTDRNTYTLTTRIVCTVCANTYRLPPWGFTVEP